MRIWISFESWLFASVCFSLLHPLIISAAECCDVREFLELLQCCNYTNRLEVCYVLSATENSSPHFNHDLKWNIENNFCPLMSCGPIKNFITLWFEPSAQIQTPSPFFKGGDPLQFDAVNRNTWPVLNCHYCNYKTC